LRIPATTLLLHLNAVRHGLTTETVIDALEDAEDCVAFGMAVTADHDGSRERTRAETGKSAMATAKNNRHRERPVQDPGKTFASISPTWP
jgi:hypothetical protein